MEWAFRFGKKGPRVSPKHLAISMTRVDEWVKGGPDSIKKGFKVLKEMINQQVELDMPILTIDLLPSETKKLENFSEIIDPINHFFNEILKWDFIRKNKIKISVLGKWYDLPGRIVDTIKEMTVETKDYDDFFLNFCVNYNGQEEIVDALRVLARKIGADSLDPDAVTIEEIKDNIYSSYFIPPELIIVVGGRKTLKGFLLWDSKDSKIFFVDKYVSEVET